MESLWYSCYRNKIIKQFIELGCQKGSKSTIARIPSKIMNSNNLEVIKAVLRGIFDADGSFWGEKSNAKTYVVWKRTHNYIPQMNIGSCSKILLEQCKILLDRLDIESKLVHKTKKCFKNNRNYNDSYSLLIRKKGEIEKWFDIVGSNNLKHQTRYGVWKKLGYLLPYTTIKERLQILKD